MVPADLSLRSRSLPHSNDLCASISSVLKHRPWKVQPRLVYSAAHSAQRLTLHLELQQPLVTGSAAGHSLLAQFPTLVWLSPSRWNSTHLAHIDIAAIPARSMHPPTETQPTWLPIDVAAMVARPRPVRQAGRVCIHMVAVAVPMNRRVPHKLTAVHFSRACSLPGGL